MFGMEYLLNATLPEKNLEVDVVFLKRSKKEMVNIDTMLKSLEGYHAITTELLGINHNLY
jgi:hypothetical protein